MRSLLAKALLRYETLCKRNFREPTLTMRPLETGQTPSLLGSVLLFEGETKLFNDGIRQNFTRNTFYFHLRLVL